MMSLSEKKLSCICKLVVHFLVCNLWIHSLYVVCSCTVLYL